MAYIPKGNSAWLLRKAINRSDSAIADLETNMAVLARTASNTGTSTTTQVLFNDAGIVNGDAGLTYVKATDALTVTGPLSTGGTLAVTGATTLTGAATVQGLFAGKGTGAVYSNTVFGTTGLQGRTAAISCTIFGSQAGGAITTGNSNTLIGQYCGEFIQGGASNTVVGSGALSGCVSGNTNSACGQAGLNNATGSDNSTLGASALIALVAGDNNTAVGKSAGSSQTAGSNNAFFGAVSYADNTTGDNQYNYGNGSVATHKFRNGDVSAANGRLISGGASAAFRTTSLSADAFTTTVSVGNGVTTFFSTITIAFTLNNNACTGILDCQFTGFNQVWGDFLFGSNQTGVVVTMRSAASAAVTGVLTVTGSGTIYTLVITCPTTVQYPSVNLRVSSGGGAFGGPNFATLPTVTFA